MAINLWRLGGQPLSYSPLPIGLNNKVKFSFGDYVIKIKAKSNSLATLSITTNDDIRFSVNGVQVNQTTGYTIALTNTSNEYTLNLKTTSSRSDLNLFLYDINSRGDIIIDSIELVEKPLPKLTINGIDGFNSGKWTFHSQAKVIDDSTLELNATGSFQDSVLTVNSIPNMPYCFVKETLGRVIIDEYDRSNVFIKNAVTQTTSYSGLSTFTSSPNSSYFKVYLSSSSSGKFTFTKPMLNLGTMPAPYSKKTGDKMVLPVAKKNLFPSWEQGGSTATLDDLTATNRVRTPKLNAVSNKSYTVSTNEKNLQCYVWYLRQDGTSPGTGTGWNNIPFTFNLPDVKTVRVLFRKPDDSTIITSEVTPMLEQSTYPTKYEPYAVQLNPKPKKLVPKKNLLPNTWVQGNTGDSLLTTRISNDFVEIQANKSYSIAVASGFLVWVDQYDSAKLNIGVATTYQSGYSFTTHPNAKYIRLTVKKSDDGIISTSELAIIKPQLEEGTTQTPYESYQLVLPRAKTGLSFNGVTDYLQLPSMTMDSIEIDCLIDSVQLQTFSSLIHADTLGILFLHTNTFNELKINDVISSYFNIPKNQRVRLKVRKNTPFTYPVTIFRNSTSVNHWVKGNIYKVTCYLAGNIVAQYDFENPGNIVSSTVLQSAKNLIPSFEDARWSLHANAQILGKDVLRLNSTGNVQSSLFIAPVNPNTTYKVTCSGIKSGSRLRVGINDGSSSGLGTYIVELSVNTDLTNMSFTTNSNTSSVVVSLFNDTTLGVWDFIRPSLYQLDGKEGQLFGRPVPLNKVPKSNRYNKR